MHLELTNLTPAFFLNRQTVEARLLLNSIVMQEKGIQMLTFLPAKNKRNHVLERLVLMP